MQPARPSSGGGRRPIQPEVAPQPGIALRFGEGRTSGVLAVSLGGLSLLAVLCFRHPELLTTADLRAV